MTEQRFERDKVLYEKKGRTAIITINRPEVMNAYNSGVIRQIGWYCADFLEDPDLWTAIITGAGEKAFSAGADLRDVNSDYGEGHEPFSGKNELYMGMPSPLGSYPPIRCNKPIIAAINGYCVGGGLEMALGCDLRIAADHAIFQVSEPRRGMISGYITAKLPRMITFNLGLELLLTGRRIDAQEAYRMGLVNKVVPLKELMPAALAMCDEIHENAPLAIRASKMIAWNGTSLPLSESIAENRRILHQLLLPTEDCKEGVRAFVEKRKPVWKCR